MKKFIKQGFKFLGVGIVSTVIDWAVFILIYAMIGFNHQVALVFAFISGAIVNFILNKKYTFENKSQSAYQPLLFLTIAASMLLFSLYLLDFFVKFVDPVIGRIVVTGIVFFANFLLHKFITFNIFKVKK